MITYLQGNIIEVNPAFIIMDVNGVGYFINISLNTYSRIKDLKSGKILTHLQIKEDAHSLYGFFEEDERKLFRALITVSGIGTSTARMIFSSLSTQEVYNAIIQKNNIVFEKVKGIGTKTAQRIIIELFDKISKEDIHAQILPNSNNTLKEEALSALVTLGFTRNLAEKTINNILKEITGEPSVEKLIKEALNRL